MKIVTFLFLITLAGVNCKRPDRNKLNELFYWDKIDYDIPPIRREQAIASGSFIPSKNGPISLGVWRDKMFVGVFRYTEGIASSLNYFYLNTTDKSPVFIPYPSFEDNYVNEDRNNRTVSLPSRSSVINVGHFEIDKCNRIWIADSGHADHFGKRRQIGPQAIIIFDLITNVLLRRIDIPLQYLNTLTTLAQIVLDFDGDNCDDVHAYVSDDFRSILVYSFRNERMWQVGHDFMGSDPHETNFVYGHLNFQWNYGVYAMTIGEQQSDGSKRVYFAPLSSRKIYFVSNRVLRDENYTMSKYYYDFHVLGETGADGHANQLLYDEKTGALFNTMFGGATIGCWNTRMPYQSMHTVHKTSAGFFPFDMNIDSNHNLWVLSNLIPLSSYDEFHEGVKNVRIFKQPVEQAITDTHCKIKKSILTSL